MKRLIKIFAAAGLALSLAAVTAPKAEAFCGHGFGVGVYGGFSVAAPMVRVGTPYYYGYPAVYGGYYRPYYHSYYRPYGRGGWGGRYHSYRRW